MDDDDDDDSVYIIFNNPRTLNLPTVIPHLVSDLLRNIQASTEV